MGKINFAFQEIVLVCHKTSQSWEGHTVIFGDKLEYVADFRLDLHSFDPVHGTPQLKIQRQVIRTHLADGYLSYDQPDHKGFQMGSMFLRHHIYISCYTYM